MHYHLIGINGTSMSGIANLLKAEGHLVTGTDVLTTGHGAEKLPKDLDVVIYSEAVTPRSAGFSELEAARVRGIKTLRRIDFIAERMKDKQGIAITGAHGKSTTTALIGWILTNIDADPTVFIGADLPAFDGSARAGKGKFVVAEACEWDRQFLSLHPEILVVTSIDKEHLDTYPDGETEIVNTFRQMASQSSIIIANGNDKLVHNAFDQLENVIWVGHGLSNNYKTYNEEMTKDGLLRFNLEFPNLKKIQVIAPLIGLHHVTNIVLAIATLDQFGFQIEKAIDSLSRFPGLKRRFERFRDDDKLAVIDDYAHHPAEIAATLRAARLRYPSRRIVAIFQPHLSERTTELFDEFIDALSVADVVIIAETYEPAGRVIKENARTSADLVEVLLSRGTNARETGSIEDTLSVVKNILKTGDVVLTIGATAIWKVTKSVASSQ